MDLPEVGKGCTISSSENGWQNGDINGSVSRLSKALGKTVGPNSLLKVMAGDELSATTQYYYQNPVINQTGNNLTSNVINALIQAISGSSNTSSVIKGSAGNISTDLSGTAPFINKTSPDAANPNGNNAKAYLSILFFDERFKFIEEGSTTLRVSQAGGSNASLTLPNIKAPKNGFAYVYVSNESDEMVYFDNLQVAHNRGRIIEENHYYAYGLKIAGISSKKLGDNLYEGHLDNKNLYNDKELIDEADLNWYDLGYRNYDPQTGRFLQIDPLTDEMPDFSSYLFAGNEPIGNIDLDGLAPIPGLNGTWANLGEVVVKAAPKTAQAGAKIGSAGLRLGISLGVNAVRVGLDGIKTLSSTDAAIRMKLPRSNPYTPGPKEGGTRHGSFMYGGGSDMEWQKGLPKAADGSDYYNFGGEGSFWGGLRDPLSLLQFMQPGKVKNIFERVDNLQRAAENGKDGVERLKGNGNQTKSSSTVPPKYKSNGIDPMFKKKGNVIYHRNKGYKTLVNGDGTQSISAKRATDTFPKQKTWPDYLYPLDNN